MLKIQLKQEKNYFEEITQTSYKSSHERNQKIAWKMPMIQSSTELKCFKGLVYFYVVLLSVSDEIEFAQKQN